MITSSGTIATFKKYTLVAIVFSFVWVPGTVFSQSQEDVEAPAASSSPRNSGPWGNNSAASGIGATSIVPSNNTNRIDPVGTPGAVPGGAAGASSTAPRTGIRLRAGATTDGRDPGGNPDVPFDSDMNLCFLAAGLVFSVWVMRKKVMLKPAVIKK